VVLFHADLADLKAAGAVPAEAERLLAAAAVKLRLFPFSAFSSSGSLIPLESHG